MKNFFCFLIFSISQFIFCQQKKVLLFFKPPFPKTLSEWNIFIKKGESFDLNSKVIPYDLVNPLFSDYALKFRTLWIPENKKISYRQDHTLLFPEGTVLTKTFFYSKDKISVLDKSDGSKTKVNSVKSFLKEFEKAYLVETRVLVKTKKKWYSIPYVWNKEQTEASLALIGKSFSFELEHEEINKEQFIYTVPNMNQCVSCHQESKDFKKIFKPIGVRLARNLNKNYAYRQGEKNQLENLREKNLIEKMPAFELLPKVSSWEDSNKSLENRSRSYLDINCAHCHNPKGSGSTSGLYLHLKNTDRSSYGFCKPPVAAGKGSDGGHFDINPSLPHDSIIYLRMNSKKPSVMMPELGRSLVHKKGVSLIYQWIFSINTPCEPREIS